MWFIFQQTDIKSASDLTSHVDLVSSSIQSAFHLTCPKKRNQIDLNQGIGQEVINQAEFRHLVNVIFSSKKKVIHLLQLVYIFTIKRGLWLIEGTAHVSRKTN